MQGVVKNRAKLVLDEGVYGKKEYSWSNVIHENKVWLFTDRVGAVMAMGKAASRLLFCLFPLMNESNIVYLTTGVKQMLGSMMEVSAFQVMQNMRKLVASGWIERVEPGVFFISPWLASHTDANHCAELRKQSQPPMLERRVGEESILAKRPKRPAGGRDI